jgi:glyoxylase-like metal-dependent hydrolase (beta-lactamase superfamily II)
MNIQNLKLEIGPYEIKSIPTGFFALDGGAMFGTVPKVLWEKTNPADENNRIQMEARALLLISPTQKILIDCGIGSDFNEKYGEKLGSKFAEMFAIDRSGATLEKSLAVYNLSNDDITHVILTHLHFDHAGGATSVVNGQLVPTFKNAQYFIQKENLAVARAPNLREKASYYPANFEPLVDAGRLTILDGDIENILPGVSVVVSHGHTRGQQMVKVCDSSHTLLYCGDVVPTSTHIRLPWVMGYDLNPLELIEEKRKILIPAARDRWLLFFEHDPVTDVATIQENKGDFAVAERMRLL